MKTIKIHLTDEQYDKLMKERSRGGMIDLEEETHSGCTFTIDAWEEVGHYSLTYKKYGEVEIGEVDLIYDNE
jgi:hypothetical protein